MTVIREYPAQIERVIDGDTIVVSVDLGFHVTLRGVVLRLRGINTPELGTKEGEEAKEYVSSLLPVGKEVIINTYLNKKHVDKKGKYGRYLADICVDGRQLSRQLLFKFGESVLYER